MSRLNVFSSTVIPTVGRSTLRRAVCSVLDQAFTVADFEVIVVNDSGRPLPDDNWQHSERVQLINTNRRERSVARNTGAALAKDTKSDPQVTDHRRPMGENQHL